MAEWSPRKEAEVRRMASQKVAAELVKLDNPTGETLEAARARFIEVVDWIDADVVAAGDRAESAAKPSDTATRLPHPPNGTGGLTDAPGGLSVTAAATLTQLLGRVDPELLKLKLWEKDLPFVSDGSVGLDEAISQTVYVMTTPQAKELLPWLRENAKDE